MIQVLSFGEIERRYDGEWVLIAYTDLDENLGVAESGYESVKLNVQKVDSA